MFHFPNSNFSRVKVSSHKQVKMCGYILVNPPYLSLLGASSKIGGSEEASFTFEIGHTDYNNSLTERLVGSRIRISKQDITI